MYKRKEYSNGGSYYPAFLCMDVNTPDDFYYIGHYPLDERTEAYSLSPRLDNYCWSCENRNDRRSNQMDMRTSK